MGWWVNEDDRMNDFSRGRGPYLRNPSRLGKQGVAEEQDWPLQDRNPGSAGSQRPKEKGIRHLA